jgi:RND family efflux transporter MFP subunit
LLGTPDRGPFTPAAVWPNPSFSVKHLTGAAERALRERRGLLLQNESSQKEENTLLPGYQIAYPIEVSGEMHGIVVLELEPRPGPEIQDVMRKLHWGAAWLEVMLRRTDALKSAEANVRLQMVLDLVASAVEHEQFQAAAMAFVTQLATKLECDRVSLGFRDGKQMRIQALSHTAEFGKQTNLVRAIESVMDEAIDQQALVVYPLPADGTPLVTRAHAELSRQHGAGNICTMPLGSNAKFFGGLTLERPADRAFDSSAVELIETVAAVVGPILDAKRREDRWLISKATEAFDAQLKKLLGPGHLGLKIAGVLLLAVVIFFAYAKGDYRVTAQTNLEGTVQRAVGAPFNGYIKEAPIRAGDIVRNGEMLCLLDDRDLKLERLKWSTQKEQLLKQYREAMAKHDRAEVQITKAKIDQAEAQISLLDEQLARTKVITPFDGIVMSGDLTQSLGAPVERGQVLFEVAPLDAYRVIVQVDERDIGEIVVGQRGELALPSMPGQIFPLAISKITPVSTAKEGRNYFRVEAELENPSPRLRPGMEGIGKVTIDQRKLIWIWTHEVVAWMRLKLWALWP